MLQLIRTSNQTVITIVTTFLSLLASLFVASLLVLAVGESPIKVFSVFLVHSLFGWENIAFTLFYTTPLLFTGLSVAIAFKVGLFNIGCEGQLYLGSIAATLVALALPTTPSYILLPVVIIAAFMAGGIWGAIPGYLKVRFGSHEVINTIMLNFIAYGISNYLVVGPFKRQGDQLLETEFIPKSAWVFRMHEIFPLIPESVPFNGSIFIALIACLLYWLFFGRTRYGYEMEAAGFSAEVSRYAGIASNRYIILAMFASGGVAGLVATHEVLGFRHTLHDNFSNGIGFFGIAVALLGRSNPIGIILASLLFGVLSRGSLFLDIEFKNLSNDLVVVIQGIIILFVAMNNIFVNLVKAK